MANGIESAVVRYKRMVGAYLIKAVVPYELREQTKGNKAKLDEVLREGNGAIGLVPHFCRTDFPAIIGALGLGTTELISRPILIPIAAHQRPPYLDAFCNFAAIELATVIAIGTRKKERQLKELGKPIPWAGIDPAAALAQYFDRAVETLLAGGAVFFAPQRERQGFLERFRGGPIGRLEEELAERKAHIPAYFSIGLEIPGTTDYSKLGGLNFRSKYIITLGTITKRETIAGDIDKWGYQDMLQLAPPAYRPKQVKV